MSFIKAFVNSFNSYYLENYVSASTDRTYFLNQQNKDSEMLCSVRFQSQPEIRVYVHFVERNTQFSNIIVHIFQLDIGVEVLVDIRLLSSEKVHKRGKTTSEVCMYVELQILEVGGFSHNRKL